MTPFPCYQALCLDQAFCSEHAQLQGLNHSLCHHPLLYSLACLERHEQHSDIAGCGSPPTSDLALTWQSSRSAAASLLLLHHPSSTQMPGGNATPGCAV